jgi:pimeloyl-ACP methyl ester carboxylesterase
MNPFVRFSEETEMRTSRVEPVIREIRFHAGDPGKPLVVFIHGMGMDVKVWSDPSDARILGGRYPLSVLLHGQGTTLETSFQDFRVSGHPVLAWSQSRPAGPIRVAVSELGELLKRHAKHAAEGIIIIGHSRGGLIGRKFIEQGDPPLRGCITLATPHRGTTMARWAVWLAPLADLIDRMIPGVCSGEAMTACRRVLRFFGSSGPRELLPGSSFLTGLSDARPPVSRCVSFGGTNPDLVTFRHVPLQTFLGRIIPGRALPDELKEGMGDGLVSKQSSRLPYGDEHHDVPLNHAAIVFDRHVRDLIVNAVDSM